MASASNAGLIEATFTSAVQEFKTTLSNENVYNQLLQAESIDDVYDATDTLQREQGKRGHLRHLSKIEPFLKRIREYSGVVEQFLQVKPEVIALIWGPIKLLLQLTSVLTQSFDAIINVTAEIGNALPEFQRMAGLFGHIERIKDVLCLFFKDILEFYAVALKFFTLSRWKYLFESLWPRHRDRIKIVASHISRHTQLMRDEVRLQHIQEAHAAMARDIRHYEEVERRLRRQEYEAARTDISPQDFGTELDRLNGRIHPDTGKWLTKNAVFRKWLDLSDTTVNVLWQYGIPGSGKTLLSCQAIEAVRSNKSRFAFVFLSYTTAETMTALKVIHALIFQLSSYDEQLQDVLRQCDLLNMKSSLDAAKDLLVNLIHCSGAVYIIVDGLDEIDPLESGRLLTTLLEISTKAESAKILFSGRPEDAISKKLKDVNSIRVDNNNLESIETFVASRSKDWLRDRGLDLDTANEIRRLLAPVAVRSKGMFLYASIILHEIELSSDIDEIKESLVVLPDHLDDLYGRILARISKLKSQTAREKIFKILGWIACTPHRLAIQELEHALVVTPNDPQGVKRPMGRLNVVQLCGPIIEVTMDDYVVLVHFTFKEYLLNRAVKAKQAILSLAHCCLTYLCQQHHEISTSDVEIDQRILSGAFRLHHFAASTWLELVQIYLRLCSPEEPNSELIEQLYVFRDTRSTDSRGAASTSAISPSFRILSRDHPDLCDWLCMIERSHRELGELDLRHLRGELYWPL